MLLSLKNRTALVTGGSKGIGLAMAQHLGDAGAQIVICARSQDTLELACEQLQSSGITAFSVRADVSIPDDVDELMEKARARFGGVDILVNNAVSSTQNTFDGLSEEEWQHHINVKLMGYIRCARAVLPGMKSNGWGRIINVAGITARDVSSYRMTNGVVNAGVTNFTKHLAEQVGPYGITVNVMHPGFTETPRLASALKKWAELEGLTVGQITSLRLKEIPLGRFIQPGDLAQLAVFLSSEAASAITGQAIAVDGGSGRSISY